METNLPLTGIFPDWPQHAARLAGAVRDLPAEALAMRAFPDQLPIWGLAAHVAGMRVYWLCGVCGEPGADATPFPASLSGLGWEDDEDHPRTADELAWALDSTWGVVASCLQRWSLQDLQVTVERTRAGGRELHTRASILNRMFTHDAFHAGEISQLLGGHGFAGIDLWRPAEDR